MKTIWEKAEEKDYPILAYRCYMSSLPILISRPRKHGNSEKAVNMQAYFFDKVKNYSGDEEHITETKKRMDYRVRLPYTYDSLIQRRDSGRDVPDFIDLPPMRRKGRKRNG